MPASKRHNPRFPLADPAMDVEKVFHMKEGQGEASYARNSLAQKKGMEKVKDITLETIVDLYLATSPKCVAVADLGSSSGSNTLPLVRSIVEAIDEKCRSASLPTPEFQMFLNDLPTNDFRSIFMALPEFYEGIKKGWKREEDSPSVFIHGVPGSFYGRLFPSQSLHFVHSSFSLHWLSRVPPALFDENGKSLNKGKMCVLESSPPRVTEAYLMQFQEDFTLFLRSRSKELCSSGRMVLTFLGRGENPKERGQSTYWELLSQSFASLVSLGEFDGDKVDTYDVHFYAPSMDEVKHVVQMEGSFFIDCLEIFEIGGDDQTKVGKDGKATAMAIRAIQEPLISRHFGEGIIDILFQRYTEILDLELSREEIKVSYLLVVLRKRT